MADPQDKPNPPGPAQKDPAEGARETVEREIGRRGGEPKSGDGAPGSAGRPQR